MSIIAKPSQSNYEPLASGTYPARLYQIIHIGTIPNEYLGEIKHLDKVRLGFEFPTETKVFTEEKGEQPYVLSVEFTLSMHEKANLRKFIEAWLGKRLSDAEAINTDIEEFLGKEGLANVVHSEAKNGNVYANIQSISPLPKGLTCPSAVNPTFVLNYTDKWNRAAFEALPEFLREKMSQSAEYEMLKEGVKVKDEEIKLDDINVNEGPGF